MLPALDRADDLTSVVTVNIFRWAAPPRNTRI